MSDDVKIKTVTQMYEAFGRGDIPAILAALADDVDWAAETTSTAGHWYGVRHGKDAVVDFFTSFGSAMEIEEFTPLSFAANDDDVLSVVRCRARSRDTGRQVTMDLHHWFRFRDGKVYFYRGTEDTAQVEAALKA